MTNIEGRKWYEKEWKNIEKYTFQAYIALLLLLAGIFKTYRILTKRFLDKEKSRYIFRTTMYLEIFYTISRVIPLNNKSAHQERRSVDKIAAVQDICEKWVGFYKDCIIRVKMLLLINN